jgi:hypothetical protein
LAQVYYPFPNSNAVWSVDMKKYFVNGDSIFNSKTYKKYYLTSDSTFAPSSWKFAGLVRQDSVQRRIYGKWINSPTEHLLYDFNLNPSDTIRMYPMDFAFYPPTPFILKILSKDSVLISGSYRTRLKANGYNHSGWGIEYWIEGIGSSWGPLNPGLADCGVADGCSPHLLCQKQNGALVYMDSYYNSCFLNTCYTGIDEHRKNSFSLVFPNPNSGSFNVQVENSSNNSIEIYNLLGEQIRAEFLGNHSNHMDLSSQPKGIYFYRVLSDNKLIGSGKLVLE